MKKNLLLLFFSIILSLTVLYIFSYIYIFLSLKENSLNKFYTIEGLEFHKEYSNKLHHLRYPSTEKEKTEYLFTVINDFSNEKQNILLQGDSWIEILTQPSYGNSKALDFIKKISKRNDWGLISAGITSFSPTLIKLQLEILEKDFYIKPDTIVAFFDQTDIGDENCRYKDNRVFKNSKITSVKSDSYTKLPFDYSRMYGESEIFLKNKNKIKTSFSLLNFKIKYNYIRLKNKNSLKLKNFFNQKLKEKKIKKCYWSDIEKYLFSANNDEISYFKQTIEKYINYVEKNKNIKKLIIVTFPHKNNIPQFFESPIDPYKHNVSNIVSDLVKNKTKTYHLNFTEMIIDKKIKISKDSYKTNDPSSHLSSKYYRDFFLKTIVKFISKN